MRSEHDTHTHTHTFALVLSSTPNKIKTLLRSKIRQRSQIAAKVDQATPGRKETPPQ